LTTYVTQVSNLATSTSTLFVAVFNLAALLVTALVVNPFAAILVGLVAALLGALLRPIRAATRRRSQRTALANREFATAITDVSAMAQEVRVFGATDAVEARLRKLADQHRVAQYRATVLSQLVPATYQGLALLMIVAALGVVYAADFARLASLGAIVLIMLRSLSYGQQLQTSYHGLYQAAPYLEMMEAEDRQYRAARVSWEGARLPVIESLRFADVTFEYVPGRPVLHDVSFAAARGHIIGVIGPSGAGKSTLVQLLLRLREPGTGLIEVNGVDARAFALSDWYDRVAFVPQDPHLFSGSVADNVRFFRDGVSDAELERAARLAHIHDDIASWPEGYSTPVGERGGQLSGGQRQRICIARALATKPDVIVLDEPTSALDVRSESLIRETMRELGRQTTVFVIAHRLSTLDICDRIMVLYDGVLQGFDDPARLEASNPFYREALKLSGMR
jgi:ABC-type multidrug transport system fused ATPase/permease subunit